MILPISWDFQRKKLPGKAARLTPGKAADRESELLLILKVLYTLVRQINNPTKVALRNLLHTFNPFLSARKSRECDTQAVSNLTVRRRLKLL
jgi:hypothetical protein